MLDNRAATYTKLGRLKPALRDAKQMIEQDKDDCTGYLRTGKVLQLMEKPGVAFNIYQLGLRRVPLTDPNARLLKGLCDRLIRAGAPTKAVDPFKALPIEIVNMIISFMTFRQTVRLSRVSKSWCDLLGSMSRLWTRLEFANSRNKVSMSAVRRYVKNAQETCSAVHFKRSGTYQENILGYVVSRCRGLSEVRVAEGYFGASSLKAALSAVNLQVLILSSHCEITYDTVYQILGQCLNLGQAEFHRIRPQGGVYTQKHPMSKMHTLVMNITDIEREFRGAIDVTSLLTPCVQIRSLTLRNWNAFLRTGQRLDFSCLPVLEHLDMRNSVAALPLKLPESIRSIDMAGCTPFDNTLVPSALASEPSILPNLSTVNVADSSVYKPSQIKDLFTANSGRFRTVDLSGRSFSEQVKGLIQDGHLSGVEKLILKNTGIGDENVSLLAEKLLPHLKQLDLARTNVTGIGVKELIITGGQQHGSCNLEWLGLDECTRTSIDAVELARSRGVKVSYRFPDPQGSKKVRHQI